MKLSLPLCTSLRDCKVLDDGCNGKVAAFVGHIRQGSPGICNSTSAAASATWSRRMQRAHAWQFLLIDRSVGTRNAMRCPQQIMPATPGPTSWKWPIPSEQRDEGCWVSGVSWVRSTRVVCRRPWSPLVKHLRANYMYNTAFTRTFRLTTSFIWLGGSRYM